MQKVLVVYNTENTNAAGAYATLAPKLEKQGIVCETLSPYALPSIELDFSENVSLEETLLIVVLGGDGTILRSARLAELANVPILGINFGHLGFLANPSDGSVATMVLKALDGGAVVEPRSNLYVEVTDDKETKKCFALNEVAVRSASGRIVDYVLDISGERVAVMRADGMVVATATGSTAYALSAGGPLMSPLFDGLVVVPLAPHTLTSRAICTERGETVQIIFEGDYDSRAVAVFLDGDALNTSGNVRRVTVRVGEKPTRLLRLDSANFYKRISNVFFK